MATLTIRKLDDEVYARLSERAKRNNRSLEAEAREMLDKRTLDVAAVVEDLRQFHAEVRARHGVLPDSTPLIREMRNE